ncbi:MAG: O-antigen ligase family protein [Oscillospiraceae bacterium]|nr:O-antigen ligase family protein [Oscillospiraceae bacterium]
MKKSKKAKVTVELFPKHRKVFLTTVAVMLCALPLITYLHIDELSGNAARLFYNEQGLSPDMFLYSKAMFLILTSAVIVTYFIAERLFPDKPLRGGALFLKENRLPLILAGGYLFFVLLSCIFSANKNVVLMGVPGEYEGLLVQCSYIVLFLTGIQYFGSEKGLKILKISAVSIALIIGILAFVEYLYKPLFEIPFIQTLIASGQQSEYISSLKNTQFINMVSLTFYNPNYLGVFCTLLFPVCAGVCFTSKGILRYVSATAAVLLIFTCFFSRSTAAVYLVLLEIIALAVFNRKLIWSKKVFFSVAAAAFAVIFVLTNFASSGRLWSAVSLGFQNQKSSQTEVAVEQFTLKNIILSEQSLTFVGKSDSLTLTAPKANAATIEQLKFADQNKQTITAQTLNNNTLEFADERFSMIKIAVGGNELSADLGYDSRLRFFITDSGIKGVGQNLTPIDNISYSHSPFWEQFYGIATGRGYAWINTIKMLPKTLFVGYGADNFALYFPQNDYVGLLNTHGTADVMIDKPHNMYLQTAINSGLISALLLIALFAVCLKRGIKTAINLNESFLPYLIIAITAFLIGAIANDSMVCVSPWFWFLLGTLLGQKT